MIPRLAACILVLAALASPAAQAFGVTLGVKGAPIVVHRDVPTPIFVADDVSLQADPEGDAAAAQEPFGASSDEPAPSSDEPAAPQDDGTQSAPEAWSAPIRAPGILLPLATVGAVPVLRDLGAPLPLGLGPLLPDAPAAPEAPVAPAPAEPIVLETAAATPVATSAASAGAALVAVAAVSAVVPAAPLGWSRLKRLLLPLALYTRIAKERLLDHGSREKLLAAIRERPGLPVTDLADVAGVPRNTATYHLRRLEREGIIVSQRSGRVRVWFVVGGVARREEAPAFAALRHDTTRAIAMQVVAEPGVDQQALCVRFGLAPSLAHWHADRLVSTGLVRKERDGRRVRYYPTEGLPRMAMLSG